MSTCRKCGKPLKKGNIQVIRKAGKRPYRVCRRCPVIVTAAPVTAATFNEEVAKPFPPLKDLPTICDNCENRTECLDERIRRPDDFRCPKVPAGGHQVGRTLEGDLEAIGALPSGRMVEVTADFTDAPPAPRMRYFITRASEDKIRQAAARKGYSLAVNLEVIPFPDYLVENDPETFADMVEVEVHWTRGE